MGHITFSNYTVTTCNFFVIMIHYVNIVLTPTAITNGCTIDIRNHLITTIQ